MVTAIWSDDPEFYNAILGGDDLLGHIFVKVNYTDISQIVNRFGLSETSDGIFTKSDGHKYICITEQETQAALKKMQQTIKTT